MPSSVSYALHRPTTFFRNILRDTSVISTVTVGKGVFNIKDIDTGRHLGYLAFLVSKEKLDSLCSYILNRGLNYNSNYFFIIIHYALDNKFYYLKVHKGIVQYSEWLSSKEDMAREFNKFKGVILQHRYVLLSIFTLIATYWI